MDHTARRRAATSLLTLLIGSLAGLNTLAMMPRGTNSVPAAPFLTPALNPAGSAADNLDPIVHAIAAELRNFIATRGLPGQPAVDAARIRETRQQAALRQLRERAGDGLRVFLRPGNRTVMQIRGGILAVPADGAAGAGMERDLQTARRFLRTYREVLRLDDPDRELVLAKDDHDDLGHRHFKFDQAYAGLPVWPAGLGVHLHANGEIYLLDGAYIATPSEVSTKPALTATEATERAKASVQAGPKSEVTPASLIVYAPLEKPARLAWKLAVTTGLLHSWILVVDAQDGRVLNRLSQVMDANVAASHKDLLGKVRDLNVWSQDGTFYMFDTSKLMFKAGTDPLKQATAGVIRILDGNNMNTDDVLKSANIVTTKDISNWLPDAVSASFNFALTYDYFSKHHNRNSLDGSGSSILAIVRVADQQHNAAWIGQYNLMVFGNDIPLAAGLDVIGHELTHGVTEKTAGLIYQDQPGALNESFSDIFGEMVENSRDGGEPDWLMGNEINFVIRNFKEPGQIEREGVGKYPAKMSEFKNLPADFDHGGVHINSSIINHAFYQTAAGLNGALGLVDSEKIFFRCLTQHLQKQSQFIDTRLGCVASAEALFGANSPQARKVSEAFDFVEIFDKPSTPEPSPIPTVQGPDSSLLITFDPNFFEIALGRREQALGDPAGGVALVESVKQARPAVSGDGSVALFVDSAHDLCTVDTADPTQLECFGFRGMVHSIAVSPDGHWGAFVLRDPGTGQPLNQIHVYDLVKDSTRTFKLLSPVADGTSVNDVLYADSMVFSSDSNQLIYDAVAQMKFAGSEIVERWSIFAINLNTETATVLLPPQEGYDTGNPSMGRAGNRYLTFEARDVNTLKTSILTLDLFTGDIANVGSVGTGLGFPCFTGDESAVIYTTQDSQAPFTGYSVIKQPLGADRLSTAGQPTLWLEDTLIGVIYRRGTFVSSNAAPVVRITSPIDGQNFTIPGKFTLEATASDSDGQIAKVEFYDGSDRLQEVTKPPYSLTISFDNTVQPHNRRLIARAIDDIGAATDSAPVSVSVGGQPSGGTIQLSAVQQPNRAIRLTITSAAGDYIIQQSTDLRQWTDIYPVTVGAGGTGSVDDSGGPANNSRLFYRAKKR